MKLGGTVQGERGYLSLFLWFSMIIGMVLSVFFFRKSGAGAFFSAGSISALRAGSFDARSFLMQVLWSRLVYVIVIILLSTTSVRKLFLLLQPMLFCFGVGGLIGTAILQFGIKGILLVISGLFPHMLIYAMVLRFLIRVLWERTYYDKQFLIAVFILFFFVIIGCLLESYVNPYIVAKVLKIF